MTLRSWYSRRLPQPANSRKHVAIAAAALAFLLFGAPKAHAGDEAPQWLHTLASAPLPASDEETEAIQLYSETNVTVQSASNMKTTVRRAYRILRPEGGRDYQYVAVDIGPHKKVTGMRAWCIPVNGKDYQVKEKDAVDEAAEVEGGELMTDVKYRIIRIPAVEPGSIIGYEYQTEEQPKILQDEWEFQERIPVQDTRYSLDLPAGWTYEAKWANYPESKPTQTGNNHWQWTISDVKRIRKEQDMPAMKGIAGQMVVYFVPPGENSANWFTNWKQMGDWYRSIIGTRTDASPELKQTVEKITASKPTTVAKMQAIGQFVQGNIRYVAIELGIGGWQPHPATDVFTHRYGDCKDKTTITISMLHEIGVEAYYVVVNANRGAVTPETPANAFAFNHVIVAIRLPDSVTDPSLLAVLPHSKLGRLLIFDPTDELTPFGQLGSYLQAGYGLLVAPGGGELIQLPTQPASTNSMQRTAKLTLDGNGMLLGDVNEVRIGDQASVERGRLRQATKEGDRIRPIENTLSASLTDFQITHASIQNLAQTDQPFGFTYSFTAPNYAKSAGGLLLVRPRVLGVKALGFATSKHPRQYPFEFSGVGLETDSFDIAIPSGYSVDELPDAADADYSFASYHSKTVVEGGTIHYRRSYEIKRVTVPVDEADKVKRFYQVVASDERNMVVLKPASH
jgi:hypothetical protein